MRVLVIEDDALMAAILEQGLREEGYQVQVCRDGREGLADALNPELDVIVLDVMLPGLDGIEITKRLRAQGRQTPVLMLTARDATMDIVKGLNVGADDYLTKPFAFAVFLARVHAAARRGPAVQPTVMTAGPISVNTASREVLVQGARVHLTRTEYSILETLLRRKDRVVTRDTLIEGVWFDRDNVDDNRLDAFMKLLRHKVDFNSDTRLIHTVRGVGYILRTEPE